MHRLLSLKLDIGNVPLAWYIVWGFHSRIASRGRKSGDDLERWFSEMCIRLWTKIRYFTRSRNWWEGQVWNHGTEGWCIHVRVIHTKSTRYCTGYSSHLLITINKKLQGMRIATNGKWLPAGREVHRCVQVALRKWDPHGLSEAVEGRKHRLALGATFNHLQSWVDHRRLV